MICDRPVVEVCPVEWAPHAEDRTRAAVGQGRLRRRRAGEVRPARPRHARRRCTARSTSCARHHGVDVDLATLPQEDAVYDMLCGADSVGVFQVESRAQMATLPRLRPRTFYDLVVEVALIRPGPIQGGSVHPYIRRRNGRRSRHLPAPAARASLEKTLGVPLFQEQLMQMAIDVAGFTAAEADQLRQAMGSKRSRQRMERLRERLYEGMAERGIDRRGRRRHLREARRLRQLRLPREPLGVLRLPRVRVGVAQAALPGGVLRRAAQRAADGLLLAAHPGAGRPPPRRRGAPRPTSTRSDWWPTLEPDADVPGRSAGARRCRAARHLGGARGRRRPGRAHRRRPALRAIEDLRAPRRGAAARRSRRWPPPVRSGCFGVDRREALWAAGAVAQVARRAGCAGHRHRGRRRRRCRA